MSASVGRFMKRVSVLPMGMPKARNGAPKPWQPTKAELAARIIANLERSRK